MSDKKRPDVNAVLAALRKRANAGEPQAQAKLGKLLQALASNTALMRMASEPEPDLDVVEEDSADVEVFGGDLMDDFDRADFLSQKFRDADSLTAKAALRHHKWNEMNNQAQFSRLQPPSVLKGTLGGQQTVFQGQQIQVADWTGAADAETTPITVTFSAVQQLGRTGAPKIAFTQPRFFRPYGIIQFGTRGFLVKAEVDIGLGTQFTVSGSQCTLQVALPADPRAETDPTFNISMPLAGMLSFFPCVRTTPVTRTMFLDGPVTGTSNVIVCPPFAKNVIVWRSARTVGFTINFQDSDGFTLYSVPVAANSDMTVPIILSDDVVYININLAGMDALQIVRAVFELEF